MRQTQLFAILYNLLYDDIKNIIMKTLHQWSSTSSSNQQSPVAAAHTPDIQQTPDEQVPFMVLSPGLQVVTPPDSVHIRHLHSPVVRQCC